MFTSIWIKNLRSIKDSGRLPLSRINVIVGANNSGKSTILRAIGVVQHGIELRSTDIRIGAEGEGAGIELGFTYLPLRDGGGNLIGDRFGTGESYLHVSLDNPIALHAGTSKDKVVNVERASISEPDNLIHPIFSARNPISYAQQSNANTARQIQPNDQNIVARVRRLTGSAPEAVRFRKMCRQILGVEFDTLDTEHDSTQQLGVAVNLDRHIPLEAMGAGLAANLNLLITLSTAKNKIILIEEPENDLHPTALKLLLEEVLAASEHNQFVITTHSSIVLTRLGAAKTANVLHVTRNNEMPPQAAISVASSTEDRLAILADLGYELPDLALNEGWMIFEEASAESLIREFLAKWFAPGLLRLTFIGARGDSRIEPLMNDYREMLLFSHLSKIYHGRAWVILDAGENGERIVKSLSKTFKDWPGGRFQLWEEANFEAYYPKRFSTEVRAALNAPHGQKKQEMKKALLLQVRDWTARNEELAKSEFSESAAEVISKLREIEQEVLSLRLIGTPTNVGS